MDPVVLVLMMTDSLPWSTRYLIPWDAQATLLPEPGSGSIPVPILTPVVCGAPTLPKCHSLCQAGPVGLRGTKVMQVLTQSP